MQPTRRRSVAARYRGRLPNMRASMELEKPVKADKMRGAAVNPATAVYETSYEAAMGDEVLMKAVFMPPTRPTMTSNEARLRSFLQLGQF